MVSQKFRVINALALASALVVSGQSSAWSLDLPESAPLDSPTAPVNIIAAYAQIAEQLQGADALLQHLTAPISNDAEWDIEVSRRVADTLAPAAQHDAASIHKLYAEDPDGPCISGGAAHDGRLLNGVPLHTRPGVVTRKGRNWGTAETVAAIYRAVDLVRAKFPDTPDLAIGDLSRKHGGKLRPHKSHQSGRDADIAYYV
ncbi:MAG: penicillin-insensitive murein endopeptidase, partial [Phycisphaerales bacterium]|nr:penicillin-insensitive murein endopeptidase [Phycisphaerales bacterium]